MKRTTRIKKKTKHRLWYLGVLTVLVLVLVIFNLALSPMRNAKKEASNAISTTIRWLKKEETVLLSLQSKSYLLHGRRN